MKVNAAFVEVRNVIGDMKGALHIVRHDNAGDMIPLLQPADETIDAVRDNWVQASGRLII